MALATKTVTFNAATIGPQSWRNNTVKGIKLSQNVVQRSDKSCEIGKALDPLPHLRDTLAQLSNDEARRYFREVRAVVTKLRESLLETNEEIKSLTRGKEALEKALEHKRKDLMLNRESTDIRMSRPAREKDRDGADDLLGAERQHLLNLKRQLEAQLKLVQQQLQVLDGARRRLAGTVQERSRVLDLICHAISSVNNFPIHSQTGSGRYGLPPADPLGSFTPEAEQALQQADDARGRSNHLRYELRDSIDRTNRLQKSAAKSVNDGMTGKIAETIGLKQHLQVTAGENRHAIHRSQRWYDATDRARGYSLGPELYSDLVSKERLDRPIIRVLQRHPGTQLPEAQGIINGGNGLLESLTSTSRNIGLLKLSKLNIEKDILDKNKASEIDSQIVRLRRRRGNHRWAMGEAF
ncbi:unnamed protein product [Owenia fusiformis]|uniref:Uncharacterized protein n=1 Tax=Owenia fusiformis TaxID=6347 RepID=A0A8J1U001_OWEFU|nr:unnamed protein product [Owenia fusiformis]